MKDVIAPDWASGWMGRVKRLPWYLAVSTPPKRIEPVLESGDSDISSEHGKEAR